MVDRELYLATLAGIDACLYELGKLTLSAWGAREEDVASIASTLSLGSPWEKLEVVQGPGDEIDVRNSDLNREQYMEALTDDNLAVRDDALLRSPVTTEEKDLQRHFDAGFRALDRHEMGLKPCPKPSALKGRTTQSKSAARKAKKVTQVSTKAHAKASAKAHAKASAKARAKASAKARAKASAKARAKRFEKASGKASRKAIAKACAKASAKACAKVSPSKAAEGSGDVKKLSETELKKKLHSESQLHFWYSNGFLLHMKLVFVFSKKNQHLE